MTTQQPRVIVGIKDSVTGWAALRAGVAQAQQRDGVLYAVRVLSMAPNSHPPVLTGMREDLVTAAQSEVADVFGHALGAPPRSVPLRVAVVDGPVGPALVQLADRPDDLLVLGARRRHHWLGHQPGRYCVARANCPVLIVSGPEFARTDSPWALARKLRRELDRLPVDALAASRQR
jgi:nucleotide-binding universal stress UspA family protein